MITSFLFFLRKNNIKRRISVTGIFQPKILNKGASSIIILYVFALFINYCFFFAISLRNI